MPALRRRWSRLRRHPRAPPHCSSARVLARAAAGARLRWRSARAPLRWHALPGELARAAALEPPPHRPCRATVQTVMLRRPHRAGGEGGRDQIMDMYMKSMHQFMDSLAKMKLAALDIDNGSSGKSSPAATTPDADSTGADSSAVKKPAAAGPQEKPSPKVFYGSRPCRPRLRAGTAVHKTSRVLQCARRQPPLRLLALLAARASRRRHRYACSHCWPHTLVVWGLRGVFMSFCQSLDTVTVRYCPRWTAVPFKKENFNFMLNKKV